jgi:hypothetical protein
MKSTKIHLKETGPKVRFKPNAWNAGDSRRDFGAVPRGSISRRLRRGISLLLVWMPAIVCSPAFSGLHETLPSWHWAYPYIDELRLRGEFDSLFVMNRPYTRGEIARALLTVAGREAADKIGMNSTERKIIRKLENEFRHEMESLRNGDQKAEFPRVGILVQENIDSLSGPRSKLRGIYRSRLAVPLGRFGAIYNGMTFDQYLVDDPDYAGKKWRGLVEYTEQAYIALGTEKLGLKFGRDFLRWGAGRSGTLLFSDAARPMDQLDFKVTYGPFRYTFIAGVLNSWNTEPDQRDSLGTNTVHRYVSAHRLEVRLLKNRLQCAVSEAILYGGRRRPVDWRYLNPFLSYHAESLNDSDAANTLGSLDLAFWPHRGMEFYGSLLIDDIQVEKTGPGDLEPNEIGWLAGGRIGDPILFSGTSFFTEYVKVTNRTYKTPNPWETFQNRNVTLGYPLGDDFDRIEFGCSRWFTESVWAKASWAGIRQGEGSIFTPFDTPWLGHTLEQGYHEPFPTGVVERRNEIALSVRYNPNPFVGLEAEMRSTKTSNRGHVPGNKSSDTFWRLGLWLSGDLSVKVTP